MAELQTETTRFLEAWMQLRQIVQASNFNRFQREGLSATQFMTLNVIPAEGMTLSDLARKLNLSKATLNETVNSLQDRGLVKRIAHPQDARKTNIHATPEGADMQNTASQEFHSLIAGLFTRMSERQRESLLSGLEQMVRLSQSGAFEAATTPREDGALPGKHSSPRSPRR